jgi:hypothetical protein
MCVDMVPASNGARPAGRDTVAGMMVDDPPRSGGLQVPVKNALAYPREQWPQLLPRCMDMITAEEVIRRIELYFNGGAIKYLSPQESEASKTIWAGQ